MNELLSDDAFLRWLTAVAEWTQKEHPPPPDPDYAMLGMWLVGLLFVTCAALNVYAVLHAWYARWRLKDGEVLPPRFSSIGLWGVALTVLSFSLDLGELPRIVALALMLTPCSLRLYEFAVGRSIFEGDGVARREEDGENTDTPSEYE